MSTANRAPLWTRTRRRLRRVAGRWRSHFARRSRGHGIYPDVVPEHTHVGAVMDALVTEAKQKQEQLGLDPDYDLLREHFDHLNFMLDAQSSQHLPSVDPIRLFLRQGAGAINSPDFNFSMANYLERYPDKADDTETSPYLDWIRRGRSAGEIADPAYGIESMANVLGLEPDDVVRELVTTRSDMMGRLRAGELGRMFAKAAEIEPLIGAVWGETAKTRLLPLGGKFIVGQTTAIYACQAQADFRRARIRLPLI